MTDWGPKPTRWFRDGRAHKRASLQRLAADLPGVGWTLVGDTTEHDPALYREFAGAAPGKVRAVLLREASLPSGATRVERLGTVPVVYGRDGESLAAALRSLG
jgi:phosphatidate phosphatase APP1